MTHQRPFRVMPVVPVTAMKTYSALVPRSTHFRPATCAKVECQGYAHGWVTTVDESTELGMGQAYYIRKQSGRSFREERLGGLTSFTFAPGQRCFRADEHRLALERPPLFIVRGGDWRGHVGTSHQHVRPEDWVEDFATHQQQIADARTRG